MNDLSPATTARADDLELETRLVHAGTLRSDFGETSEALFLTQGHVYESAEQCEARFKGEDPGYIYARFSNPTVGMFEARMAALEGAEAARATATGMAAVTASLLGQLRAGDHVVAARQLFGSCRFVCEELLPRFGIASTLVDGTRLDAWRAAVRPETKAFFLESPTNPNLDLVDIAGVAEIAHAAGANLVVDNVFATPLWQSPLKLGADCVVYSATKHIDGQGRCLGGVILGSKEFIEKSIHGYLRQTGPALSPFNAWVLLKGLETLTLRVGRQTETAAAVADALAAHPNVMRLIYPGRPDHPQAELVATPDEGRLDACRHRGRRRQGGRVPLSQRVADRQDLEQPRRCEEPHHPSGDDDPRALRAGGPRGDGRDRGPRPAVGRLGAPEGSDPGSRAGARGLMQAPQLSSC